MLTGDIRLIKNLNDSIVLNLIREKEIISGAELANITGMRPSTIANIIKNFIAKELIVGMGKGKSTEKGGKRPFLWSINKVSGYTIGIDVEIGQMTAVLLNMLGETIVSKVHKVDKASTPYDLVKDVKKIVNDTIKSGEIKLDKIIGMGVAIAGIVNSEKGIVILSDTLPETEEPLLMYLKDKFPFPIIIENNANAAAIGSMWVGVAKGVKNFMLTQVEVEQTVGGIGFGLVINGELYSGATFCSGEINVHLPKLGETIRSLHGKLAQSPLLKEYSNCPDKLTNDILAEAALKGDEVALEYYQILGHIIGRSIAREVGLLNPEMLVLAGSVSELGDLIIDIVVF